MLQHDASSDASAVYRPGVRARLRPAVPSRHHPRLAALSGEDRAALGIWAAAHLALLVLAWASAWAFRSTRTHAPLTGAFEHWDASLLRNIASYGYFGRHAIPNNTAFFPGYPVVLSAAHLIVRNWALAELAVPAVAGCFAVVSLARRGGWWRAALLAGLAGLVRPDGLFLIPALVIMALTGCYGPDQGPGHDRQLDAG